MIPGSHRHRLRRLGVVLASAGLLLSAFGVPQAHAAYTMSSAITGQDIGWPMCPTALGGAGKPMPPDTKVGFLIPELNAGLAFDENSCLEMHYNWGKERNSLLGGYLFPNYPDKAMLAAARTGRYGTCSTLQCRLKNTGYAQAKWNVARLTEAGIQLPLIWVDIEHQPRLNGTRAWSKNIYNNRLVLEGVFAYLKEQKIRIGLYSYAYGYNQIVGKWRLGYPEWVPTGKHTASARWEKCKSPGFSNGPVWMTQSTRISHTYDIDDNTICPAGRRAVPLMFSSPQTSKPVVAPVRDQRLTRYAGTILQFGDRGPAVAAAQRALKIPADGVYGAKTRASVLLFQQFQGWSGNGMIGPKTWLALGA